MVEALVCTSDWLKADEFSFYKEPTKEEFEFYDALENIETQVDTLSQMTKQVGTN
ncbi:PREDICTED: zinc finger BED domain-containing [Prunus dulcis]|uniref:PREDICTED: zinc finger BED domain-containing n=1 Tax=Prunus dulcis TaxID=3755 RepID=A0A5E4GMR6_PRUDU|nr:PREDICTED: zinc finger BED domain-containing [Prunus dulcis]